MVSVYPEDVQFRLTASSREKLLDDKPFPTEATVPLDELFVKLHFRLKIFHGLEYRYVQPALCGRCRHAARGTLQRTHLSHRIRIWVKCRSKTA